MFPGVVISEHRFARRAWHGTEAVTQQMPAGSERRKFFAAAIDLNLRFHFWSAMERPHPLRAERRHPAGSYFVCFTRGQGCPRTAGKMPALQLSANLGEHR